MLKIEVIRDNVKLNMALRKEGGYEHMYSHAILSIDIEVDERNYSDQLQLMRMDVDAFVQSLKRFVAGETNRVELFSMDDQIYFRGVKTSEGKIQWKGTIKPLMNPEQQFSFDFFADEGQFKVEQLSTWRTAPMRSDM